MTLFGSGLAKLTGPLRGRRKFEPIGKSSIQCREQLVQACIKKTTRGPRTSVLVERSLQRKPPTAETFGFGRTFTFV